MCARNLGPAQAGACKSCLGADLVVQPEQRSAHLACRTPCRSCRGLSVMCRFACTPCAHLMMRTVMAPKLLPSNARRSAHSSYSMHPSAHTSVAVPYGRPCGGGSCRSVRCSALLAGRGSSTSSAAHAHACAYVALFSPYAQQARLSSGNARLDLALSTRQARSSMSPSSPLLGDR